MEQTKDRKADDKQLDDMTIDETFALLDGLLEKMEDKDISLEDSFSCYQKGIEALKSVNNKIDSVEKQVKLLNSQGVFKTFDTADE